MRLITLRSAAALAIAGTGLGIYVGNAAIDAIDPLYYSPLPSASYASLAPYRSTTTSVPEPIEASATEARYALGNGCVGCRTYPEEYHPDASLEQEEPSGYYAASLGAPNGYREAAADAPPPDAERTAVERYASYAVVEPAAAAETHLAALTDADAVREAEEQVAPMGPEQPVY